MIFIAAQTTPHFLMLSSGNLKFSKLFSNKFFKMCHNLKNMQSQGRPISRRRNRKIVIAPPPIWWQAGCDRPFFNPGPDPVLEQKFFKRLSDLERPWPSFALPCGEGGYCYNRNVVPYVWH